MTAQPSPPSRRLVLVGALGAAAALAGCSKEPEPAASPSASPTTSRPQVSADGTGTVAPPVRASLLTGLPVADGPVLAVKIDNTAPARPRVGLGSADVVYVEPVEGGLTRLNAVFSTRMPAEVGPVRSGRVSDASILASYGTVAFAYSGASSYTNARLGKASLLDVSMDSGGTGYRRERSRRGPYDVDRRPRRAAAPRGRQRPAERRRASPSARSRPAAHRSGARPRSTRRRRSRSRGRARSAGGCSPPTGRPTSTRAATSTGRRRWCSSTSRWSAAATATPPARAPPTSSSPGAARPRCCATASRSPGCGAGPAAGATSFSWNGAALPFAAGNVWVVLVATKQAVTLT